MDTKINILEKDILYAEDQIIGHCCNTQNTMNSGVAKALRIRFPEIYQCDSAAYIKYGKELLGKCAIMGGGLQQYRIVNRKLCIKHHHSLLSTLDWMKNNNAEHYPLFFSNTPEIFAVYQEEPLIRFMIQNQEYFRTYMGADNSPEKILVAHKLWAGMTPRPKFNGYEQIYDWKMIKQAELVTRFPHMTYIIKPIWQIRQELGLEKIC